MWTADLQHNTRNDEQNIGYKGIPIYAGYNLHEKVFELVTEYISNKDARILILGAGSGAFDQRLIDNGYTNLLAVEYHKELYIPKSEVVSCDLNSDFDDLGKFDAIVAIEIIEHLENQFHFMRQIKNLLKKGGTSFVTSPNVESPISRIKFFLRGDMSCFTKTEVTATGHINPVFSYIFETHLSAVGMTLKEHTFSTTPWDAKQFGGFKQKTAMLLFRVLSICIRGEKGGQLSIFVVQK